MNGVATDDAAGPEGLAELARRAEAVRERVARAAGRVGRDAAEVKILPVTKGHPPAVLRLVADAGFDLVGESRVGEAEGKLAALGRLGLAWHMVGHLQRNKAARAAALFDVIESVDSLRLAHRLALVAEREGRESVRVLAQVNASGEASKSGFRLDRVVEAVDELCSLGGLEVSGLMTMAPYTADERVLRTTFRRTREALESCNREITGFAGRVLSMGMTNDFEIAVEEGSTEIRLGTVLLGERPDA